MNQAISHKSPFHVLQSIGRKIPSPIASAPLLLILEIARRTKYLQAPESLYGKVFQIEVEDLGLSMCFQCDSGRFKPLGLNAKTQACDLKLSAKAMDFLRLSFALDDADSLFFQRRLRMQGNTELGVAVKYWLDASERPAWLLQLGKQWEMLLQK
jgi:predicted lipid carrier protein YhbT